jgi:hypothetical protein
VVGVLGIGMLYVISTGTKHLAESVWIVDVCRCIRTSVYTASRQKHDGAYAALPANTPVKITFERSSNGKSWTQTATVDDKIVSSVRTPSYQIFESTLTMPHIGHVIFWLNVTFRYRHTMRRLLCRDHLASKLRKHHNYSLFRIAYVGCLCQYRGRSGCVR